MNCPLTMITCFWFPIDEFISEYVVDMLESTSPPLESVVGVDEVHNECHELQECSFLGENVSVPHKSWVARESLEGTHICFFAEVTNVENSIGIRKMVKANLRTGQVELKIFNELCPEIPGILGNATFRRQNELEEILQRIHTADLCVGVIDEKYKELADGVDGPPVSGGHFTKRSWRSNK